MSQRDSEMVPRPIKSIQTFKMIIRYIFPRLISKVLTLQTPQNNNLQLQKNNRNPNIQFSNSIETPINSKI